MQNRARWLLLAAVLVPGLVVGAMATALMSPNDAGPNAWATETTLWLGIAAVLAVTFGLGLAAMRLWLIGPVERIARHMEDLPLPDAPDALARIAAALDWYRRQNARDRVLLAGQLDAVEALRGEAAGARAQLHEADRLALVGRVAMGVSHELGGPLALLTGWLERLRTLEAADAPADARMRCIGEIESAAQQIERLLTELARPGLQRTRDADRPCDLLAVALRLQGQAEQHPRLKQMRLTVDATDATHPADASASHVEQVLLNLVLNAADAMKRQGELAIRLQRDGNWQIVDVDDAGPGVPLALRDRIFEPLFSTQPTADRPGQSGWGLGLAISRRTLASYGGSLTVADSPLGGARFRLQIPAAGRQSAAIR